MLFAIIKTGDRRLFAVKGDILSNKICLEIVFAVKGDILCHIIDFEVVFSVKPGIFSVIDFSLIFAPF